jgi:protein-S-isoprenylcysteine O-methyltransferase Ste14
MFKDVPLIVVIVTVWTYWATVVLLAWYQRVRHGRSAGILPRHGYERRLWLLIVPVVAAWVILPVLAGNSRHPWLGLPAWALSVPWVGGLRCLAAVLAATCYVLSVYCWLSLGRHWSMAIVPGQTSHMVTVGPYRWVRHPIYSLQVALMLASAVAVPTVFMALVACLHLVAMNRKARYEERHLAESFGPPYLDYCQRVGRFWPRLVAHERSR